MEGWGLGGGVQPTIIFLQRYMFIISNSEPPPPSSFPVSLPVPTSYRGGGWIWLVVVAENEITSCVLYTNLIKIRSFDRLP